MWFLVTCNSVFMVVLIVVGKYGSFGLCGEVEVFLLGVGIVFRVLLRYCLLDI